MANSLKYGRTLTIRTDNTTHNPHLPHAITTPCGPSQCLPHPRSPIHHLCPTHSTLVITFLSPTLCHTHIHPLHLTQLSVLTLSCCLHILVCTHPCHLAQLPHVFHLQPQPQHNATLSLSHSSQH